MTPIEPDPRRSAPRARQRGAGPRPAEGLPRRRAGRRQDLRDAAARRRRRKAEGVDVVVGVVETHGRARDRRRCSRPRGHAAPPRSTTAAATLEEFDLDAALARRPAAGRWSTNSPTPTRRQPPPQALAGRGGAARRRHRRLDHAQRPAPRKPERRGRADHRRARARDRARLRARPRRRDRAGRPRRPTSCSSGWTRARSTCPETAQRARSTTSSARAT